MTADEYLRSEVLLCDVKLPPATTVRAGCSFRTLRLAMALPDRPRHFDEPPTPSACASGGGGEVVPTPRSFMRAAQAAADLTVPEDAKTGGPCTRQRMWYIARDAALAALEAQPPAVTDVEAMRAACIAAVRAEQKYEGSDFPVCNAIVHAIEQIPAHPPAAEVLGRFGHHPEADIDYGCEVEDLIAMAYDRLTGMREHPELEERIRNAMDFRTLETPLELRWLNQHFNGAREVYAKMPDCIAKIAHKVADTAEDVGLREAAAIPPSQALADQVITDVQRFLNHQGGFAAYADQVSTGTTGWSRLRSTIWLSVNSAIQALTTPARTDDAGQAGCDVAAMREAVERFIADVDDADRAEAGTNPLMLAHITGFRAAIRALPTQEIDHWMLVQEVEPDASTAPVRDDVIEALDCADHAAGRANPDGARETSNG